MVKWISMREERLELLGEHGLLLIEQVEALQMLHAVDDNDVIRIDLLNGDCAWCAQYDHGWSVVAVAPMGDVHDTPAVSRKAFYAAVWPATWRTRWKKAPVVVQSRTEAVGLSVGSYVAATLPDKSCRFAQVAAVDHEGRPTKLYYTPLERINLQATGVDEDCLTWFPIPPKWPDGCDRVFRWQSTRNRGIHGNYNFLTKRFGVEQKRANNNAERKEKKQERRAARAAQAEAPPQVIEHLVGREIDPLDEVVSTDHLGRAVTRRLQPAYGMLAHKRSSGMNAMTGLKWLEKARAHLEQGGEVEGLKHIL